MSYDTAAAAVVKDFKHLFYAIKGYKAVPTTRIKESGKVEYNYSAISNNLVEHDYLNHLEKIEGLTPSPIYETNLCCWGAIDVDVYNWDEDKKITLLKKAIALGLVPANSKSGGIHLWCFSKIDVLAKHMRNYLCWARDELVLDPKTEIFPKQIEVTTDEDGKEKYGNGITIPYRAYYMDPDNSPCGLNVYRDKIFKLPPYQFIKVVESKVKSLHDFEKTQDYVTPGDKDGEDSKQFYQDDDLDISRKEIIKAIKEKQKHPKGGTFDNWITLYVAKAVSDMETDTSILYELEVVAGYSDKATKPYYFENKIRNCRKSFSIVDPEVVHKQIINTVVYIKSRDKYFDTSTNEEYKKEAIDFTYARYF